MKVLLILPLMLAAKSSQQSAQSVADESKDMQVSVPAENAEVSAEREEDTMPNLPPPQPFLWIGVRGMDSKPVRFTNVHFVVTDANGAVMEKSANTKLNGLVSLPLGGIDRPANIAFSVVNKRYVTQHKSLSIAAEVSQPQLQNVTLLRVDEVEELAATIPHLWVGVKDTDDSPLKYAFVKFEIEDSSGNGAIKKTVNTHLTGLVSLPLASLELPATIRYTVARPGFITSKEQSVSFQDKDEAMDLQLVTLLHESEVMLDKQILPMLWVAVKDINDAPMKFTFVHFTIQDYHGETVQKTINTKLNGLVCLPLTGIQLPAFISFQATRINHISSPVYKLAVAAGGDLPEMQNITLLHENDVLKSATLLPSLWVGVKDSSFDPMSFASVHFRIQEADGHIAEKTLNTGIRGLVSLPLKTFAMPVNVSYYVTRINHIPSRQHFISLAEGVQPELQNVFLLHEKEELSNAETESTSYASYLWVGVQDLKTNAKVKFATVHFTIEDVNGKVSSDTVNTGMTGVINLQVFSYQMPALVTYSVTSIGHYPSDTYTIKLIKDEYPELQTVMLEPKGDPNAEFLGKKKASSRDEQMLWFSVENINGSHIDTAYISTIMEDSNGKTSSEIIRTNINGLAFVSLDGMALPVRITFKTEKYGLAPRGWKIIDVDSYIPDLQRITLMSIDEAFSTSLKEPSLFIGAEDNNGKPVQFGQVQLNIKDADGVVTETTLNTKHSGMVVKTLGDVKKPAIATFYFLSNGKQVSENKTIDLLDNSMPAFQRLVVKELDLAMSFATKSSAIPVMKIWFSVLDTQGGNLEGAYIKTFLADSQGNSATRIIKSSKTGLASLDVVDLSLPLILTYRAEMFGKVPTQVQTINITSEDPEIVPVELLNIDENFAARTKEPHLFIGVEDDAGQPVQFTDVQLTIMDTKGTLTYNLNTQQIGMVHKVLDNITFPARASFFCLRRGEQSCETRTIQLLENSMPSLQILKMV